MTRPSSFASFTRFENFQAALSDHLDNLETHSIHTFPQALTDWKFCPVEEKGDVQVQKFSTGKDFLEDCDLNLDSDGDWPGIVKRFEGKIGMKMKKYPDSVVIFQDMTGGEPKLLTFDSACKRLWKM